MEGTWQLAPIAGALAVGPNQDDLSWWSNDAAAVTTRECLFDDQYVFDAGTMSTNDEGETIWTGEYTILTDGSTWLETWQGVNEEQCGEPVAPHDESNAPFTYEVNEDAGTVTLFGKGAYFGLAKVTNNLEFGNGREVTDIPESITYTYIGDDVEEEDHHATFLVDYSPDGDGVWVFVLENQDYEGPTDGGNYDGPTDVTFHLDFNTYLNDTSKTGTAPFLNGTFNNWCGDCNPMTDEDGDGVYTITIPLPAGDHEWKFTADGWNDQEMFDAGTAGTIGDEFVNRLLTVVPNMMEMNVGPYCWNTFEPCPPPSASVTFRLNFSTYLADPSKTETAPFLNGTFNGWCGDCNPMTDEDGDGIYTITIPLDTGLYEWKFTAGGWNDQEMFDAGTAGTIGDEFVNRLLTVVPNMMEMNVGPYCWNTFEPCPPPSASVTFRLNFSTYLADPSKTETAPFLNGTFNGWCGDCNPMTDEDGDGIYTITIPLPAGDHELKFTAGGWNDQEMFDAGTEGTVGTEFVNRIITIAETDIDTDVDYGPYCWNQFVDCE